MKHTLALIISLISIGIWAQPTDSSLAYKDVVAAYEQLANTYSEAHLTPFGETDAGEPLQLFLINSDGLFFPEAFQHKVILLIQNGIHAGEPCGVDASLQWATEMLAQDEVPKNVLIAIIPAYNIGGMLNRGCCSRANQNGPEFHGFRGNANNLDLNRDYIKADSRNALTFYRIFHWLKPHVFVDTHTSNGADYQYTMSLITSRYAHYESSQSAFIRDSLEPYLFAQMSPMTPYVNAFLTTPDKGFSGFNDGPRYACGYASLFGAMAFTTEAHMLKPFADRVAQTHKFLKTMNAFMEVHHTAIMNLEADYCRLPTSGYYGLNLAVDSSQVEKRSFLGFDYQYKESIITGKKQLHYLEDVPTTFEIPFYNTYVPVDEVKIPQFYVIKKSQRKVIERLNANGIVMRRIPQDTLITGVGTYVQKVRYSKRPYEGHLPVVSATFLDSTISMTFQEGDYLIGTQNQCGWRYLMQVMEPRGNDSFFKWNFFDAYMQQKEHYSSYVFEPYAAKMFAENDSLRNAFNAQLVNDTIFAKSARKRLDWWYYQSKFYEKEHKQLPFVRIF